MEKEKSTDAMHAVIVAGGAIDDTFALDFLKRENPKLLVAADSGMHFFHRNQILPRLIIGDFDSVEGKVLSFFQEKEVEIHRLNPMKDDTDTEAALRAVIARGAKKITILGGTGSRLDHVLGNVALLGIGLSEAVSVVLLDAHNRIRMIQGGLVIKRREQFGTYVSLLPYTRTVEHLYLSGFRYPLTDACLQNFSSLGISNEIIADEGKIEFEAGILLVIESRDI